MCSLECLYKNQHFLLLNSVLLTTRCLEMHCRTSKCQKTRVFNALSDYMSDLPPHGCIDKNFSKCHLKQGGQKSWNLLKLQGIFLWCNCFWILTRWFLYMYCEGARLGCATQLTGIRKSEGSSRRSRPLSQKILKRKVYIYMLNCLEKEACTERTTQSAVFNVP